MKKAIDWTKAHPAKAAALVGAIVALIVGLILLVHYYLWVVLTIIIAVIWLATTSRDNQAEQARMNRQLIQFYFESIVFIMRNALLGVAPYLCLPKTQYLGYKDIRTTTTRGGAGGGGVKVFRLVYTRMPDSPSITEQALEACREVLTAYLKNDARRLPFPDGIGWVEMYVIRILVGNGEVQIDAVVIDSQESREWVQRHISQTRQRNIVGDSSGTSNNAVIGCKAETTSRGVVYDDEL